MEIQEAHQLNAIAIVNEEEAVAGREIDVADRGNSTKLQNFPLYSFVNNGFVGFIFRSRDRRRSRDRDRRSSRDRHRDRDRRDNKDKEKERERKRKGLPEIKKEHLSGMH